MYQARPVGRHLTVTPGGTIVFARGCEAQADLPIGNERTALWTENRTEENRPVRAVGRIWKFAATGNRQQEAAGAGNGTHHCGNWDPGSIYDDLNQGEPPE
jgi:hypothetical protein